MSAALKWRLAILLVIVFFAGLATGLFAGARHARDMFFVRHSAHMGERMREHLKRELKLTPEQFEKVAPILDDLSAKLEAIRNDTSTRVTDTMQQAHSDLAPLLTPEQREKLQQMKKRHQRMIRARGEGHPHPH